MVNGDRGHPPGPGQATPCCGTNQQRADQTKQTDPDRIPADVVSFLAAQGLPAENGPITRTDVGDAYLAKIRQVIYARSTALATRELLVQLSRLGNRAGVIGGASMVLDELFSAEHLARWIDKGQPAGLEIVAA